MLPAPHLTPIVMLASDHVFATTTSFQSVVDLALLVRNSILLFNVVGLQDNCAGVICTDSLRVCNHDNGECECANGYTDATQTACNGCVNGDQQICNVPNGKGTKVCVNGNYSACTPDHCDPSYQLLGTTCIAVCKLINTS